MEVRAKAATPAKTLGDMQYGEPFRFAGDGSSAVYYPVRTPAGGRGYAHVETGVVTAVTAALLAAAVTPVRGAFVEE